MYSNIVNPKTGRRVSVKSRLGKDILRKYLFILSGGAAPTTTRAAVAQGDDFDDWYDNSDDDEDDDDWGDDDDSSSSDDDDSSSSDDDDLCNAVGHTEYKKDQDAQYNTVIGNDSGGGSWVDVVILDSPDPPTGMYEIRHRDNAPQVVCEDKLRHIPMNEADWASQSLLMALGTRLPDGSGVDALGSGSHGLRQVVNSNAPMRKIFQYAKLDVDLTVCNATLTGHSDGVKCVAVLADGRLATGSYDKTVKVWKESSPGSGVWSVEATLTRQRGGHSSHVCCVAVLPDGRLATGSGDDTVKVWG